MMIECIVDPSSSDENRFVFSSSFPFYRLMVPILFFTYIVRSSGNRVMFSIINWLSLILFSLGHLRFLALTFAVSI